MRKTIAHVNLLICENALVHAKEYEDQCQVQFEHAQSALSSAKVLHSSAALAVVLAKEKLAKEMIHIEAPE